MECKHSNRNHSASGGTTKGFREYLQLKRWSYDRYQKMCRVDVYRCDKTIVRLDVVDTRIVFSTGSKAKRYWDRAKCMTANKLPVNGWVHVLVINFNCYLVKLKQSATFGNCNLTRTSSKVPKALASVITAAGQWLEKQNSEICASLIDLSMTMRKPKLILQMLSL